MNNCPSDTAGEFRMWSSQSFSASTSNSGPTRRTVVIPFSLVAQLLPSASTGDAL